MGYGDKVKVSILETNGVDNFDGAEERELTADISDFDNTGTSIRAINVSDIIKELRKQVVFDPEYITTSLDGTTNLDFNSATLQIIQGTATGHSLVLPDALTIFNGAKYEIINDSNEDISIRDNDNNLLAILNIGQGAEVILEDNALNEGSWFIGVQDFTATGITNYKVSSNTLFITTSPTDDLITGFTVTPLSGTYAVWFSADITITQNNRDAECVVYKGGFEVVDTRRRVQGVGSNYKASFQTLGVVTVDGIEAVDIRANISSGSLAVGGRTIVLVRLG